MTAEQRKAKLAQKREERKKKDSEDSPSEKRELVMHGAKLKCEFADGLGELKITSNEILLQDKLIATKGDGNNMINLQFKGKCNHPKWPAQNMSPPPCMSVIKLTPWQKLGTGYMQNQKVLVKESCITCDPIFNSAVAKPIPKVASIKRTEEKDEKIFKEEGIIKKGYTITENGKIIVVNKKGIRNYDSIYGDAPSEMLMKQNGMTDYDIFNVNLTKFYFDEILMTDMKSVLIGFSDVGNTGKNGADLANHFFSGKGMPFTFENDSNVSKEIKNSERFNKTFLDALKQEIINRYNTNKSINDDINPYQFETKLPYYSASEGFNPYVNEAAAFMGGIQGCIAKFKLYKYKISGKIIVEIKKITFLDTFGAGWEDGGANGAVKQWIPGLVSMFCLQHFKNANDKSKYQPFTLKIEIEL